MKKNESALMTQLKIFLGYITRNGATQEELEIVAKYQPFYKSKKES